MLQSGNCATIKYKLELLGIDMVDEKKICLMSELARFESGAGKEDLRIVKYTRSDYIGLGLLKNFFVTTFSYALICVVIIAFYMDYLLENLHMMNLKELGIKFVAGYLIFLWIYSVITYITRRRRYEKAKRNVRQYYAGLKRLSGIYYGGTSQGKQTAGGKRS